MQKALERHGYQTASPAMAPRRSARPGEMKPDLIFMDVVMPGVNGFQATRKLASDPDTKAIPVIMVISKDQETGPHLGMRRDAKDYLVKPVSMEKLIEKAQAALTAGRLTANERLRHTKVTARQAVRSLLEARTTLRASR